MNRAEESPDPLHGHDTYKKVSVCFGTRTIFREIGCLSKYSVIITEISRVDWVVDSGIESRSVRSGCTGRGQEYEGEICTQIY